MHPIWSKKIALWLAIVLIIISFGGGALMGSAGYFDSLFVKTGRVVTSNGGTCQSAVTIFGKVVNRNATDQYLSKDVDFGLFWQAWDLIKNKSYHKDIGDTQMFYGAMTGLVASLNDPYSVFFTPQANQEFQSELSGTFEGIGAEVGIKNNVLTVIAPLPDTPSFKAGIKAGDVIVAINGTTTENMSVDQAISLIRGPRGTQVTLSIFRTGFAKAQDFKITRQTIDVKSLTYQIRPDNIAYIQIRQFNADTYPLLQQAIVKINSNKNVKGLIVDLRNNPGGYLDAAVNVASEWVGNKLVVTEKDRDGNKTDHSVDNQPLLAGYKTVILANQGSASASEILAGALKDWGLATIVGMKTFGKGSVQDLNPLPDGSSIKLTIAKWFTPKDISIDQQGIQPDVQVDLTETDYNANKDPQLDKAVEIVNQK